MPSRSRSLHLGKPAGSSPVLGSMGPSDTLKAERDQWGSILFQLDAWKPTGKCSKFESKRKPMPRQVGDGERGGPPKTIGLHSESNLL